MYTFEYIYMYIFYIFLLILIVSIRVYVLTKSIGPDISFYFNSVGSYNQSTYVYFSSIKYFKLFFFYYYLPINVHIFFYIKNRLK